MLNNGLIAAIRDLAVEVFHTVDQGPHYFLTVCARMVADITRVARTFALDKDQHFRALPLIRGNVQHV
jgi:hypothetical protein